MILASGIGIYSEHPHLDPLLPLSSFRTLCFTLCLDKTSSLLVLFLKSSITSVASLHRSHRPPQCLRNIPSESSATTLFLRKAWDVWE